jgi:Protein of unknown function (DUF3788)
MIVQPDTQNAFVGHPAKPSSLEVATALGPSIAVWTQFIDWLADTHDVLVHEWKSDSLRYGWSLRLKKKDRTIVYLGPCHGCFRVAFVLGSRAMDVVRQTHFPPAVEQAIAEAPHYAEGTGIRLIVRKPADLLPLRTLAEIKLAN